MNSLIKFGLVFTLFLSALFLSTPRLPGADTVNIGVLLPLSGKLAKFGEIEKKSFIMGMEDMNRGLKDIQKKIHLIIKDSQGNPTTASRRVKEMIHEEEAAVVAGGCSSSVAWKVSKLTEKLGVPFLITTASADKITGYRREFTFRIAPPVSEHSNALLSFLKQTGCVSTVAVIYQKPNWRSKSIRLTKELRSTGIRLVLRKGFRAESGDLDPLVQAVQSERPDLVYLMAPPAQASRLIVLFKGSPPYPRLFIWRSAGFLLPEFKRETRADAEYVVSSSLWAPTVPYTGARRYYNRFKSRYTFPPEYHGAQAYAAMEIIAEALRLAASPGPESLRDALARTDIMSVFGPVRFVSYGRMKRQNRVPSLLVQWMDGVPETIWPKDLASRDYVCPYPR